MYPSEYEGHLGDLMVSTEEIKSRINELAELIHKDYEGSRPVMLCTLKGACPFYQHLLDAMQDLKHGYTMEFLRASSYAGISTTGNVKVLGAELERKAIENRHVILVEDIVDTGTTVANLIPKLQTLGPKSIQVCTLLEKRLGEGEKPAAKAKYSGFSIPNKFIIGYGLDYNELYRDLKDIWVITQAGIDFDATTLS